MSYYGPPPQQYQQPPPGYGPQIPMEPPEATSIKSMLNITGILALIFGILFLLGGALWAVATLVWPFYFYWWFLIGPIFILIWGIVDILIYMNCKAISQMVDRRQYVEAKSKTLVWMIMGWIFGGILPGILMLIAYIKYDDLIRWGQPGQHPYPQQPYGQPPQQYPPQQYPQQQYQQPPPPQQPRY